MDTIEEIQRVSAALKQKELEYREADKRFQEAQHARLEEIRTLKGRLANLSDQLIEEPTVGWCSQPQSNPASKVEPTSASTKSDLLLKLYEDNPRATVKDVALAIYGTRTADALKKVYALRDYMHKQGSLKKEGDGSWSVLKPGK